MKNDARTDVVGDNYYNSTMEKNFKAFLQHIGVSVDRELTDLGFKLYNIGLTNGPNSKIFRDYFTKCVLEEGKHLDLIFDLDELAKKHRGEKTTEEIIVVMEKKYEEDGLISRNPNRIVGAASKTEFLKYELILWRSLGLVQTKGSAKPNITINSRKITEVLGYPELL